MKSKIYGCQTNFLTISKPKLTLLVALLITALSFAQQGINYKALIKDNLGNVLSSQSIGVQFQIREATVNGTAVYTETHTETTDANGILILNIGTGTTSDIFTDINWSSNDHWLNIQIDITGGTNYIDMSTTQFMAVPYALVAKNVENEIWDTNNTNAFYIEGNVGIGINSPINPLSVLQPTGDANTVKIETLEHPSGKDLLELIVPQGSTDDSQFIEMQNGYDIVAVVNSDGSAQFKSVQFGDGSLQTTAYSGPVDNGPIAYGTISSTGSILSGTGNFTVDDTNAPTFYINVTGSNLSHTNSSASITPLSGQFRTASITHSNGDLRVYIFNSSGTQVANTFQFVIYKL